MIAAVIALSTPPFWNALAAVTGDTPEARIETYVRAVARGDERGAIDEWQIWTTGPQRNALVERRASTTRALIAAGLREGTTVVEREWWSACCELRVIPDRGGSGVLRAQVRIASRTGGERVMVFDVVARDTQPVWEGLPARQWALSDVYSSAEAPLALTSNPVRR